MFEVSIEETKFQEHFTTFRLMCTDLVIRVMYKCKKNNNLPLPFYLFFLILYKLVSSFILLHFTPSWVASILYAFSLISFITIFYPLNLIFLISFCWLSLYSVLSYPCSVLLIILCTPTTITHFPVFSWLIDPLWLITQLIH